MIRRVFGRFARFKTDLHALLLALKDGRTPWYARVIAVLVAAYVVSPVDALPDVVPFVGIVDDFVVIPSGVYLAFQTMPELLRQEFRARAEEQSFTRYALMIVGGIVAFWIIAALGLWLWLR